MKVLVTGAAGFIGGQLWHTLWQRGDEVVGIDNFSYGNLDNLKFDDHDFGPEVRRMDIRDREALPKLFEEEKPDISVNADKDLLNVANKWARTKTQFQKGNEYRFQKQNKPMKRQIDFDNLISDSENAG